MPLEIIRNDITKMQVDAIVNAANSRLQQGGGVCGAIFSAAGEEKLQAECDRIGHCPVGSAVLTGGYSLPAKHVIHTVGPVWQGGGHHEEELLAKCYANSLDLALVNGLTSIAFPLIASGIFGYPKDQALQVAIASIGAFLLKHEMQVYLVVYDKAAYSLSDKLFKSIESFIDDNYISDHRTLRRNSTREIELQLEDMLKLNEIPSFYLEEKKAEIHPKRTLDDILADPEETFTQRLLCLIDNRGKKDAEIYKRANIDRRLFSKIRSNPHYQPSKNTAIALAIALELNLDDTKDLLGRAGYALTHSSKFDLIVEYFIRQGNFNVFEINEALYGFDQSQLGA